jgi:nucleotide sugar dehydrogenase
LERHWRSRGAEVVAVQGLGFVGAAVAPAIAASRRADGSPRYLVLGLDLPSGPGPERIAAINRGSAPIGSSDPELDRLTAQAVLEAGNLAATHLEMALGLADYIVVDIPLDVADRTRTRPGQVEVDQAGMVAGIRTVGRNMKPEALVLVETTLPLGACREMIRPVLEEEFAARGLAGGPKLAYAAERVMPGPDYVESIRSFWRCYAGTDPASAEMAEEFLSSFIDTERFPLRRLGSPAAAEMGKLLENSYRAMNIAFIQEWTLLAERAGVNLFEVVEGIRQRRGTHDNMRLPGFGVGGYCLTKDGLLAQWAADRYYGGGLDMDLTLKALEVNYHMPLHTLELTRELAGGELAGKTITLCGVSYLPGVPDTRNSPSELFLDRLEGEGAKVLVCDPLVGRWQEKPGVRVHGQAKECIRRSDGVVLAVPHRQYLELTVAELAPRPGRQPFVVDAQNMVDDQKAEDLRRAGCRLAGVGKGHWRGRGYQWPAA